jgi:hypothetical protein
VIAISSMGEKSSAHFLFLILIVPLAVNSIRFWQAVGICQTDSGKNFWVPTHQMVCFKTDAQLLGIGYWRKSSNGVLPRLLLAYIAVAGVNLCLLWKGGRFVLLDSHIGLTSGVSSMSVTTSGRSSNAMIISAPIVR